ncbi:MAG: transglycosylase domain-containing protein [Clostridia bacterium]|nr:transglycosylase domain-containing protein [Clostridia bacterium]
MTKKNQKKLKTKNGIKILFFMCIGLIISFMIMLLGLKFFILHSKDDLIDLNLSMLKNGEASTVYFLDKTGEFKEYKKIFSNQNRIWVEFSKIPKYMKDVIIAMEDKRFYKHGGIDLVRTATATFRALIGKPSYGGSSITQQLVKNLTEDNKPTIARKMREFARALKIENIMSKDEILEAYLNIIYFGNNAYGVQMAAKIYFDKNIENCSLVECAAIAIITNNPGKYNPFVHPEENKKRRNIALYEMLDQKKITKEEFDKAIKESENLKFANNSKNNNQNSENIRNWYLETLYKEIIEDLCNKYNIKKNVAETILCSGGLKIYACIDPDAQEIAEKAIINLPPKDKNLELGFAMTDYNGRILAILGSSKPKNMNWLYNRASSAPRQPGSIIKPLSAYAPALDNNIFTYSSKINDEPLELDLDGSGTKKKWPNNWYKDYKGPVTLQWAIEKSANAPVAQVLYTMGLQRSFEFLTKKLNFSHLDSRDANLYSALATGGTHGGVTPVEMAAAYQIFGNYGKYYKPTTYFYVTNKKGNVILDNRELGYKQVIREDTAYVMNRLMRQVIIGAEGTGRNANIENWEIVGKTGTTNDDHDSWFVGLSPVCLGAIWTGSDKPKRITETRYATSIWKKIMKNYLDLNLDLSHEFKKPNSVESYFYCTQTGYLANEGCPDKKTGYYCSSNIPPYCYAHSGSSLINSEPAPEIHEDFSENIIVDPNLEEHFFDINILPETNFNNTNNFDTQ